jgi:preprotein translocase subunit SecF
MIALLISFILISFVIFILFRTFVPTLAVIFSIFADIVMPLALINFLGIKISAAGIAAFLMLIGYSVDTDILLTTRAIRKKGGTINSRLYGAFKTGSFMTSTALIAVIPAFFIVSSLPDSFRQIFLILALGLFADLINTWMTNMSIIKWYCEKKRVE